MHSVERWIPVVVSEVNVTPVSTLDGLWNWPMPHPLLPWREQFLHVSTTLPPAPSGNPKN